MGIIASFADLATKEVVANGVFTFPGLCKIKTRVKPATRACQKEIFGKMQTVKARSQLQGHLAVMASQSPAQSAAAFRQAWRFPPPEAFGHLVDITCALYVSPRVFLP